VRSVQRSVTADELRRGVRVDLVDLSGNTRDERVIAWVEPGDANLEYDGRVARPGRGSLVGTAPSAKGGPVSIRLGKRRATRAAALERRRGSRHRPRQASRSQTFFRRAAAC